MNLPVPFYCSQNEFANLDEAQLFISSKLHDASNPRKTYQYLFDFETGKAGMVSVMIDSKDDSGKTFPTSSIDFFLEDIDPYQILEIRTKNELKLEIHTKKDQKLFKITEGDKTSYTSSLDFCCNDPQTAEDIKEAILYLIDNSVVDKIDSDFNVSKSDGAFYEN